METQTKVRMSPLAIWSLALGVFGASSIFSSFLISIILHRFVEYLYASKLSILILLLSSISAVICGHVALRRISRSSSALTGRGLAKKGFTWGYVGILLNVVSFLLTPWNVPETSFRMLAEKSESDQVAVVRAAVAEIQSLGTNDSYTYELFSTNFPAFSIFKEMKPRRVIIKRDRVAIDYLIWPHEIDGEILIKKENAAWKITYSFLGCPENPKNLLTLTFPDKDIVQTNAGTIRF